MGKPPSPPLQSVDPQGEFAVDVPEQLFYLLFRTFTLRDALLGDRLAEFGITTPRWRALAVIRRLPECSMSDLARLTGTDRTTLTRSVDQLVGAGLVDRRVSESDRRRVVLELTSAGQELYAQCVRHLMELNREAIEVVPTAKRREMVRTLESLVARLAPSPADAEAICGFTRRQTP